MNKIRTARPFSTIALAGTILLITMAFNNVAFAQAQSHDRTRSSGPFSIAQTNAVMFNIPAQPLRSALTSFAEQSGWQLFYSAEVAEGIHSNGITGSLSPESALKELLTGTGLDFRITEPRTVTLVQAQPAASVPVVPAAQSNGSVAMDSQRETVGSAQSKPVKLPEVVVKEVRERDDTTNYVVEEASTATRTDTPLIKVPQSVEVVTQKVIQDQRAVRMQQAVQNVSGVATAYTSLGSGSDQFFCRGFLCDWFKNNLRNVSTQQALTFRDIANVQRIEVLKGPPSVLYGRNSPGGILNLMTKQPLEEKYASLDTMVGSYSFYRTMMDVSGPFNESKTLLFRVNGAYENHESFRDIVQGQRYFVAPVFTWKAGSNTTITFEGEYIRDNDTYDPGLPAVGTGPARVSIKTFVGEPFSRTQVEEYRAGFVLNHRFNDAWHIESLFRADNSKQDALIVLPTSLAANQQTLNRGVDQFVTNIESYYWRNDLIGKLTTGSIKHTVLTGVELGRQTSSLLDGFVNYTPINIYNPVYGLGPVPSPNVIPFVHSFANTAGAYVQDEVDVLDNLHVLIGARGDYYYQHTNRLGVETKSDHWGFSPRIGVTYQVVPAVALYSNVTRSFNPTFTLFQASNNQFIPQTGTQYEAGIKTDIVPGRLFSNFAVYRIVQRNVPTADPGSIPPRQIQTGEQRSQGIEFDLTAQLLPGWKVITSYAYTDARITADNTFTVGNRLPRIPYNSGSFWTTYDFQDGPLQGFGAGAGIFAAGERTGDLQNTFNLPGYVRADAALYYRKSNVFSHTNLTAQLNVQNLLDQEYYSGGNGLRTIGAAFPGAPLTFIGSIKLEFY